MRVVKAQVGILVCGPMREAHHLAQATREALDGEGFPSLPIIAGTGVGSTRETVARGADYAIVVPSGYFAAALGSDRKALKGFFNSGSMVKKRRGIGFGFSNVVRLCESPMRLDGRGRLPSSVPTSLHQMGGGIFGSDVVGSNSPHWWRTAARIGTISTVEIRVSQLRGSEVHCFETTSGRVVYDVQLATSI